VLGISIVRIRALLNEYVFGDGSTRTTAIEFTSSDFLVLSFWHHSLPRRKTGRISQTPGLNK